MSILDAARGACRWAAGAVVPMFARPVGPVALAWLVQAVLVAALAVGLYQVQRWGEVTASVGRGPDWFRPYWLPALFLLGYFLGWSVVWLARALAPNQPAADFPDLDAAWAEVLAALDRAGVGTADTPIFLVLGGSGGDPLFGARPPGLVVDGGTGPGSPLRVYASRDGIYLAVPGASLLGARGGGTSAVGPDPGTDWDGVVDVSDDEGLGRREQLAEIQRIIQHAQQEGRPLTEDEKRHIGELSGGTEGVPAATGPPPRGTGPVPLDPEVSKRAADRLRHLCELIAATRWPLCPVNGAVLAVPVGAAETDEAAQQWGLDARQDLVVAEAGLRLRFPVYALVGGAEGLPGGDLFFERLAAETGDRRLGRGFPLNPELRPADAAGAVEAAAGWVFGHLLPYSALRLMRVGGAGGGNDTRDNAELVRFLAEVGHRGPHLARLVSRAAAPGDRAPLYGGCYLTVPPRAGSGEAPFAKGFFRKVESTQGYVAWTGEAFAADAGYRRATGLGYAALAAVLTGVLLLGWCVADKHWPR